MLWIIATAVVIPVAISLLFLLPVVQTGIVKYVTNRLSSDLKTEISIYRVSISPFSGIQFNEFLVRDQQSDTLFYAQKLNAGIESFSIKRRLLYLSKVRFESPVIHIKQYNERMNFSFILDSFSKTPDDSTKWHYSLKRLLVSNGKITFEHSILKNPGTLKEKLNFYDLELDVLRTSNVEEELHYRVNRFSVKEDVGLFIKDLSALCKLTGESIFINDLIFRTNESHFNFKQIEIPVNRNDSLNYGYKFKSEIYEIAIASNDVRKIFGGFPDLIYPIRLSGNFYGSLDNLKGRKISCLFGEKSRLVTSFDLSGLSNFNETFVYLDVEELVTNVPDLETIIKGGNISSKKVFPRSFQEMGTIRYKGNFTGFVNDLVAYGTFITNLGTINTDLGLKILPNDELIYGGLLRTKGFNLGKLLAIEETMGEITLDMEVSGSRKSSTDYFTFLDGNILSMKFKDYLYQNIELQGLLTHQKFDGSVKIDDPNGKIDFKGKVDMSGDVPHFNFLAVLANVQLDRLKIVPSLTDGVLSMVIETNFEGDNLDDLIGEIKLSDGLLYTPAASVEMDSVSLRATRDGNKKNLVLKSDFADGELNGSYYFGNFNKTFKAYINHFLPALNGSTKKGPVTGNNNFEFELRFKKIQKIVSVLFPDISVSDEGYLKGKFIDEQARLSLDGELDYFSYKNNISAQEMNIWVNSNSSDQVSFIVRANNATYGRQLNLPNFSIHQKASGDTIQTNVFWNNWDEVTNSGALYSTTNFNLDKNGKLNTRVHLHQSSIIVSDMQWQISQSRANIFADGISINGFKIEHQGQYATLNGFLHRQNEDGLNLVFNQLDLSRFFNNMGDGLTFSGTINGNLMLRDYYRDPLLTSNIKIDSFHFNNVEMGTFSINSFWNQELEALAVSTFLSEKGKERLRGSGFVHPDKKHLDFQFNIDSLNVAFLDPFIGKVVQNMSGTTSGKMYFKGPVSHPFLTGRVKLNDGNFSVDLLQTTYSLTDSVVFYPNEMRFKDMTLTDRNGRSGKFRGSIYHNGFSEMVYNLRIDANNMLMLNTKFKDNPYYYGTVYGTGFMQITGTSENINIAINGRTRPNTQFFIPVQNNEEAAESNFIRFSGSEGNRKGVVKQDYTVDLSGVKMDMDIEVTPDAQVQIIFDARLGDILRSSGAGNIQIRLDRQGNIRFYGDYTIEEGEYLFSLQNLINKRFLINQGGRVRWQGDPYDALIDITAVYKLRASISDLLGTMSNNGSSGGSDLQRRIPVNCNLYLSDRLQQPVIKFGIETPTLDKSRETLVLDYFSSEEELNRQVLSLLLLNKFHTPEYLRASDNSSNRNDNTALVTTTEMLSSQISHWVSTISNDLDIGVAYRPGDNITTEEFELALSTQVFNNRVTINGNVGYGKYQSNTSKMIGDFDVDVKLNQSGTLRARAYTRSNDDLIYEISPTTQGIGISFKEEFNNLLELLRKYRNFISGRNKNEEKEE